MARKEAPDFKVIKDTREQQGYFFGTYKNCAGMIDQKLDTGDYTIEGLEDKICIERKASVEEIAVNLGQKKYAFMEEINRMAPYKHKFLILEFNVEDVLNFPDGTRIPEAKKKTLKITGNYIMKMLNEFELYHDIHVLFCGDKHNAFLMVSAIFRRVNEMYTVGQKK